MHFGTWVTEAFVVISTALGLPSQIAWLTMINDISTIFQV